MSGQQERLARVRALIAAEPIGPDALDALGELGTVGRLERLCQAASGALPVDGAGIGVMTADGAHGVAAASDLACAALEDLHITLGEGPGMESFALGRPVLVPDLDAASTHRWPGYREAAHSLDARAVFAFPLQMGAARLGVFNLYRRTTGTLSQEAVRQALTFAEVAVETLLDGQEHALPGRAESTLDRALDSQFTVYQAQGMAMIDLGVSLTDAMARLRAHAYTHDRPLQDVARDIVDGRLRLEPDPL